MGKAKTLKKRERSPFEVMKPAKLANGVRPRTHNPNKNLLDIEFIQRALLDCVRDCDQTAMKEIIQSYYDATNTTSALKAAQVSRSTYYDAIKESGNMSVDTMMKLITPIFMKPKKRATA